jgi:hypothetical protein
MLTSAPGDWKVATSETGGTQSDFTAETWKMLFPGLPPADQFNQRAVGVSSRVFSTRISIAPKSAGSVGFGEVQMVADQLRDNPC